MSMSDPIADMLTRVRNALSTGHKVTDVPASTIKTEMCEVLKKEGYIRDYEAVEVEGHAQIRVELKYLRNRKPVIRGLRRISKPSLRVYAGHAEIKPVRSGLGISILSTSQGVMTGKQARDAKAGGEVLCEVW